MTNNKNPSDGNVKKTSLERLIDAYAAALFKKTRDDEEVSE